MSDAEHKQTRQRRYLDGLREYRDKWLAREDQESKIAGALTARGHTFLGFLPVIRHSATGKVTVRVGDTWFATVTESELLALEEFRRATEQQQLRDTERLHQQPRTVAIDGDESGLYF